MRYNIVFCQWSLAIVLASSLASWADIPKVVDEFPLELNATNYESWRDHILPAKDELDFQKIPWLTTFKDGILTANREDRPLLLWTMNGHPLGCT